MNVKDLNLLKWTGANSFRTSHYPYSEEVMDLADSEGIVVIDESPAVGMNFFNIKEQVFGEGRVSEATLEHHLQVMRELVTRDKNHPCVVMWSIANEAAAYEENAIPYFRKVAEETRKLDPTRPITMPHDNDTIADRSPVNEVFDVISVNRYYGWSIDTGHLEVSEYRLEKDLKEIYGLFNKPVMITEYGADSIAGFHQDPPVMFTEEFQCEMLERFHNVFDSLDFVVGEHVWCFADFATKQGITRAVGNRKGVFTRDRTPKAAAFLLKKRWTKKD
jgi:beta-glucuronidase